MCKLFILSNGSKIESRSRLVALLKGCAETLTPHDKDGFGWAAYGTGGVYGEKYLVPDEACYPLLINKPKVPEEMTEVFIAPQLETFGEYSKIAGGLLVHARMSTNSVNLTNAHPHRTDEWTLIHNGVVQNKGDNYEQKSTCDTEHLVYHLSAGGLKQMTENITGYYAIGAINNKTGELIVVKDDTAQLYGCYVQTLKGLAFATSRLHLESICKAMSWKCSDTFNVTPCSAFRFTGLGQYIERQEITPRKAVTTWSNNYADNNYHGEYYDARGQKELYGPRAIMTRKEIEEEDREMNQFFRIKNSYDREISFKAYCKLSKWAQEKCVVTDRDTGVVVDMMYELGLTLDEKYISK